LPNHAAHSGFIGVEAARGTGVPAGDSRRLRLGGISVGCGKGRGWRRGSAHCILAWAQEGV